MRVTGCAFNLASVTSDRQHAPQPERLEAIKEAVASLAGTCRGNGWRRGAHIVRRGFRPGQSQKRRYAALRWISRLHTITLITGIEHARESHPKPRDRPKIFMDDVLEVFRTSFGSMGLDGSARRCFFAATSWSSAASRGRFSAGASSREGGGGGSMSVSWREDFWALNMRRARVCASGGHLAF